MKIITKLSPKRLFNKSKKEKSTVSRSDHPSSFSSSSSSDDSVINRKSVSGGGAAEIGTPTSVLPEISSEWSENNCSEGFKIIDRENNGTQFVSRSQLEALLCKLGGEPPSREELSMMLSELDRDGGGSISVEDFLNRVDGLAACEPDSDLRETFDFFDTDHDGKITAEELLGALSIIGNEPLTLEDCRRMISVVDKNGDGFVCFEDFSRMMELKR